MTDYILGTTETTAEKAGYSQSRITVLADYCKNLVDIGRVRSAGFLMARGGEVFAHQSIGKLTYKSDSPEFRPDSLKGIASITKVLTATAVMKLVEDGVLWLEQPISSIIKEFQNPMHQNINLWHLLTHTSGLPADPGYFTEPYGRNVWNDLSKKDWIKRFLTGPVQSQPGEQWSYSSPCFGILAEIVSRVSGKHFYDFVSDEIFKPLGMNRTFFEVPENLVSEASLLADWEEKEMSIEGSRDPKGCPKGSGGAWSTMEDLYKLGQCYLNGGTYKGHRLMGRTTCEAMIRDQLEGRGVFAYHWGKKLKNFRQGLCWEYFVDGSTVNPAVFMHEGWGWCSLFIDPRNEFIYVSVFGDDKDWDPDVMVKTRTIAFSGIE